MYSQRNRATKLAGLALAFLALTVHAQGIAGDYVVLRDGTEVMSVTISSANAGRIVGKVSVNSVVPLEGTINGQSIDFTTRFPDGTHARWTGKLTGSSLQLTVQDQSGESQQMTLVKRGTGWSADSPLAQQWLRRLTAHKIIATQRTGGGSYGGAVKDMALTFCPQGRALYNERFALSIAVPGAGGSQTSRRSNEGHWRAIASGNTASIEIRTDEGEVMQLGIRDGNDGVIRVANQPMRLVDADGSCS